MTNNITLSPSARSIVPSLHNLLSHEPSAWPQCSVIVEKLVAQRLTYNEVVAVATHVVLYGIAQQLLPNSWETSDDALLSLAPNPAYAREPRLEEYSYSHRHTVVCASRALLREHPYSTDVLLTARTAGSTHLCRVRLLSVYPENPSCPSLAEFPLRSDDISQPLGAPEAAIIQHGRDLIAVIVGMTINASNIAATSAVRSVLASSFDTSRPHALQRLAHAATEIEIETEFQTALFDRVLEGLDGESTLLAQMATCATLQTARKMSALVDNSTILRGTIPSDRLQGSGLVFGDLDDLQLQIARMLGSTTYGVCAS